MTKKRAGYVLVTGGAGFIGTNLVDRLARDGQQILIYDNLSRPGAQTNLEWLLNRHGGKVSAIQGDVRNAGLLAEFARRAEMVFHLAAEVTVSASLIDPVVDFEVNARGTLNLLEALRSMPNPPPLVYTSTNKVLGGLEDIKLLERRDRYEPESDSLRNSGIGESRGLDFSSPHGCSKGAADQYVLDYARSFGLRTVVFRLSSVYGPHQYGTEDQGWVAHFARQAITRKPITFYGDGKQVRDILFVDDLVNALLLAVDRIDTVSGHVFHIGGGKENTVSLIELVRVIAGITGSEPNVRKGGWRLADQRYYVSDTRKFRAATGWSPSLRVADGVSLLFDWLEREPAQAIDVPLAENLEVG